MNISSQFQNSGLSPNKVLSQTYRLLGMTLLFAAFTAFLSMHIAVSINPWLFLISYFIVLFLVEKNKNNSLGIVFTFALTGLLGFSLGPVLNYTVATGNSGLIVSSFISTAAIFFVSSIIGMNKEKDYSSLGVFATIGILISFVVSLLNILIFKMSGLQVIISAAFVMLSTLVIVWETNNIVRGGERNYISATVTLFVSLYNIFSSVLNLLLSASSDD